jgi:hypothetical protein
MRLGAIIRPSTERILVRSLQMRLVAFLLLLAPLAHAESALPNFNQLELAVASIDTDDFGRDTGFRAQGSAELGEFGLAYASVSDAGERREITVGGGVQQAFGSHTKGYATLNYTQIDLSIFTLSGASLRAGVRHRLRAIPLELEAGAAYSRLDLKDADRFGSLGIPDQLELTEASVLGAAAWNFNERVALRAEVQVASSATTASLGVRFSFD